MECDTLIRPCSPLEWNEARTMKIVSCAWRPGNWSPHPSSIFLFLAANLPLSHSVPFTLSAPSCAPSPALLPPSHSLFPPIQACLASLLTPSPTPGCLTAQALCTSPTATNRQAQSQDSARLGALLRSLIGIMKRYSDMVSPDASKRSDVPYPSSTKSCALNFSRIVLQNCCTQEPNRPILP